ncbi:hypothetical protein ABK040_003815 [Willaertia magna]
MNKKNNNDNENSNNNDYKNSNNNNNEIKNKNINKNKLNNNNLNNTYNSIVSSELFMDEDINLNKRKHNDDCLVKEKEEIELILIKKRHSLRRVKNK